VTFFKSVPLAHSCIYNTTLKVVDLTILLEIKFAALQFFACAALSYLAALYVGDKAILLSFDEWKWVIISGILAVGLGYTLQVIGQTTSPPAQAAVIMSLEAAFAAIAGYFYYGEILGPKALIGCILMFTGCLLTQRFPPLKSA
ncbi:MAG: DMT family transporter, partial [Emcibacter sp.]|nr:DMT family transporter [Emcibacter sp.]